MKPTRSTLHSIPSTLFWLALAAASLLAIVRVGNDYLSTVRSLQDFRWRVAQFQPPIDGSAKTVIGLEVENLSALDLGIKDLEVYLWANDLTVGKTYGRFELRTIKARSSERLPLTIELDPSALRDAKAQSVGKAAWRVTGTYKVSTFLTDNDFLYRLGLDIAP